MAVLPCFALEEIPDAKVIRLPGGISIEAINVLAQIQPAMTPLVPALSLIDAVIAVFKLASGLPGKILSVDLPGIAELIEIAAQKMGKVASLVPQLSIPLMVLDVIDCLIIEIERLQTIIIHLEVEAERIEATRIRAEELGNPDDLLSVIECADGNVQIELDNQMSSFQALSQMFALLDLFLSILGVGSTMPDLSDLSGIPLEDAYDALEAFVEPLKFIRSLIPIG